MQWSSLDSDEMVVKLLGIPKWIVKPLSREWHFKPEDPFVDIVGRKHLPVVILQQVHYHTDAFGLATSAAPRRFYNRVS